MILVLLLAVLLANVTAVKEVKATESIGVIGAHQKKAIVIGVSQQDDNLGIVQLPGIEHDLKKISSQFSQRGFQVEVMQNPDKRQVLEKISSLQKNIEQLVFYYSGHGVDAGETGYLVPVISASTGEETKKAAEEQSKDLFALPALRNELISHVELHESFKQSAAQNLLAIFDTNTQKMCRPKVFSESLLAAHYYCAGPRALASLDGGLFTELINQALNGEADKDKDTVIDALELEIYTKQQLENILTTKGYAIPEPAYFHYGEMQFSVLPD